MGRMRGQVAVVDGLGSLAAAITHRTGRVLGIQRVDDDRWWLPGGPIRDGDVCERQLRSYVRRSTGFDVRCVAEVGTYGTGRRSVVVVRCEITGVGADMSSGTCWLRWMDAATATRLLPPPYADAATDAIDSLAPRGRPATTGSVAVLPAGADRAGGVEGAGDAVAVGLAVPGQQGGLEVLEAVE